MTVLALIPWSRGKSILWNVTVRDTGPSYINKSSETKTFFTLLLHLFIKIMEFTANLDLVTKKSI